jgi:hypothetical protein
MKNFLAVGTILLAFSIGCTPAPVTPAPVTAPVTPAPVTPAPAVTNNKPVVDRYNERLACAVLGYDHCAHYKLCLFEYQNEHKWSNKCDQERKIIKRSTEAAEKAADAEFHEE